MARILIADWSPDADMLAEALCQREHQVEVAVSLDAAKTALETFRPDVVLLGEQLVGTDGLVALQDLTGYAPLMFMGATPEARTLAAKLGADAVVDVPVDVPLLDARISVVVRRVERQVIRDGREPIQIGQLSLWPAQRMVTVDGRQVALTHTEYLLLREMVTRAGEVVGRNDICQAVWQSDDIGRSLETHIWRLRAKLNDAGLEDPKLVTLRSQGFRLISAQEVPA
jgi:DNA-binding response OmpR family regulator